jgi:protein-L-isoaspartate(D-aspartate) O-methyltransferase
MTAVETSQPDFAAARRAMIDSQLRTSGINEPWVLERMLAVPRENFVPEHARVAAYVDRALPLGDGRMLSAPLVQARLLTEARPQSSDRALVVDSGSGYLAALVEGLVGSVVTASPENAAKGAIKGEYTLVLIDGAVEHVPPALAKRLASDGRLVTGVIENSVTRLAVGRKAGGAVALLPLAEIGIPRLSAFDKPKVWSF